MSLLLEASKGKYYCIPHLQKAFQSNEKANKIEIHSCKLVYFISSHLHLYFCFLICVACKDQIVRGFSIFGKFLIRKKISGVSARMIVSARTISSGVGIGGSKPFKIEVLYLCFSLIFVYFIFYCINIL